MLLTLAQISGPGYISSKLFNSPEDCVQIAALLRNTGSGYVLFSDGDGHHN